MRDFLWIILAYVLAILGAFLTFIFIESLIDQSFYRDDGTLLMTFLIADIAATVVVFVFSMIFRNASFYDPYWSIAPIVLAIAFLLFNDGALFLRQIVVTLLTLIWGIRLTGNWVYRWQGITHEDWRYVNLRRQTGLFWLPVNFLGIHVVPTVIVFLGCLSMYPALAVGTAPINWWDGLALLITGSAIWLETQADLELHHFRNTRKNREEILTTGVWGWCRHPNYLGEIGFWIGLFVFGYAAQGNTSNDIAAGPISMVLLFLFVSIPMIDRKLLGNKPEYEKYKLSSFALIPFSKWIKK